MRQSSKTYAEMDEKERSIAAYDTYLAAYAVAVTGGTLEEEFFDEDNDDIDLSIARVRGAHDGVVKARMLSMSEVAMFVREMREGEAKRK